MALPCSDCGTSYVELFTSRYCPVCEPNAGEEITLEYDTEAFLCRNARDCAHENEHHYEHDSKWWCRACGTYLRG